MPRNPEIQIIRVPDVTPQKPELFQNSAATMNRLVPSVWHLPQNFREKSHTQTLCDKCCTRCKKVFKALTKSNMWLWSLNQACTFTLDGQLPRENLRKFTQIKKKLDLIYSRFNLYLSQSIPESIDLLLILCHFRASTRLSGFV